ncbi:hypothetical protein Golax_000887, partial [Gossypium laxum]|nr:hypothetical protein [Gossypium laxum]
MEDALASLKLLDDEEEAIHEVADEENFAYQFCLVGRCLTDSVVHFPSLRNTMADLWHPIRGIYITEAGEKRNSVVTELKFTEFWVQVHDLPPRSMNESMAKQFGNFCGNFLEYDTSIPTLGIQAFLRTRVRLDVTAPLKREKKVLFGKALVVYTRFKYEKLSLFYFIYGRLGHGESFCPLRLQIEPSKIVFGWDLSLRAVTRRRNTSESKWLRSVNGSTYEFDKVESPNLSGSFTVEKRSRWSRSFGYDGGDVRIGVDGAVYGSLALVSNEEDDPIALVE